MNHLRAFFLRHRAMAFAMMALAMAMKALIPTGYMVSGDARTLTVRICDGYADAAQAVVVAVKSHGDAGKTTHDQQACPFSGLSHAGLTGADQVLLGAALAFILLLGFVAPIFAGLRPISRLRPPLRAPPALV
jgi:hypothetical protein